MLLAAVAALLALPLQAQAQATGICGRTAAVRIAILGQISGVTACANVTDTHLAAITYLELLNDGITALAAGDFDGLTAYGARKRPRRVNPRDNVGDGRV